MKQTEPMLKRFCPTLFTFLEGERISCVSASARQSRAQCCAKGKETRAPAREALSFTVASHPAQSKVECASVQASAHKMTTTKNPIDIVFGVLVIVAGVLLCLLVLRWMYCAVVELMSWKEAEKKCVAMRSGLLDNQASGHNQCREVVLQVQEGKYLNMKGFDDLNAETNGALTRNQYDVICFVVKHQASRCERACRLFWRVICFFCVVLVPIVYYGVWLIITDAGADEAVARHYETVARREYEAKYQDDRDNTFRVYFLLYVCFGTYSAAAAKRQAVKDVLAELNAKVGSAQLSFHDVDGKLVVRVAEQNGVAMAPIEAVVMCESVV